jgi:hypothetical protein
MRYDSNLCLYLQPHITPLRLGSPGLTRLPVFWEDDVHWQQTGGDWRLERYVDEFASPGLKIINVHPFIIAANVPTEDHYVRVKKHITTLSDRDAAAVRYDGPGPRTFLTGLVQHLRSRGCQILALHEVYESLPVQTFLGSLHRCGS